MAVRLGWSRRIPELGRLACALVALPLIVETFKALGVPAQIMSAVMPLIVVTAFALSVLFVVRIARRTTLAQAAGAADTRAGLKDELKSAHWFAQHPAQNVFVEVLLTRAAHTAQKLDARALIPLRVPRSGQTALILAVFTAALTLFSPRLALPVLQELTLASTPAATGRPAESGGGENELATMIAKEAAPQNQSPDAAAVREPVPSWVQLEEVAKQLPAGTEEEAVRRAVAARDARLVAKLLQALRHKQADAAELDSAQRSGYEPVPANQGQGSLEQLQEALQNGTKPVEDPLADALPEPTARVTQRLREQAEEERRKMAGTPAEGDPEFNPRMRAVNRGGVSMREMKFAAGEAAEAGARTSVDGHAMGPPDGKGRSGGSSGEHPESSYNAAPDMQPVLGAPSVRLEVQLRQVRVERSDDPEQDATREEFYAETQRRASQLGYESLDVHWRTQREVALRPGQTPLSYREAIKRYFLTRHGREEQPQ
ncbi:MAG: hypothetical protein ACREU7_17185 [Burkholderiales bacterium]